MDPLAEKGRSYSPYNYVLNNPINLIDPDRRDWLNDNDKKIAKRLQGEISNRLKEENKTRDKSFASLLKGAADLGLGKGSKKDLDKLSEAADAFSAANENINNLTESSNELLQMGAATQMFTFQVLPNNSPAGFTSKSRGFGGNGLITMQIASDANAIHETKHGWNIWQVKEDERFPTRRAEVRAYGAQYSFDKSSVTGINSDKGAIKNINGITTDWVKGLYTTDDLGNKTYYYDKIHE